MSSYTPGPWEHVTVKEPTQDRWGGPEAEVVHDWIRRDGRPIALICKDAPSAEANARLIAAAPELLEALKRLESVVSYEEEDSIAAAIDQANEANEAIEKAEGT